jgi:hypothetical protein
VRYRDWKSADLDRARAAVAAWRDRNRQGTADQLIAEIACHFHPDYPVAMRAVLFAADRQTAHRVTGVVVGHQAAPVLGDAS